MGEDLDLDHLKLELGKNFLLRDEVKRLNRAHQFEFKKTFGKNKPKLAKLQKKRRLLSSMVRNGHSSKRDQLELLETNQKIENLENELRASKAGRNYIQSYLLEKEREYGRLRSAFDERLERIRKNQRENQRRKYALYAFLGIAPKYFDSLIEDEKEDGTLHLFFGGKEGPLGYGHAHYIISPGRKLIYKRDPFEVRGRQNHIGPHNDGSKGGFDKPQHGYLEGEPYSFAYGWGTRKGFQLVTKGHLTPEQFRRSPHVIYGPGEGPINGGSLKTGRQAKV